MVSNQSEGAISPAEFEYCYPPEEHRYYTEEGIGGLLAARRHAADNEYPSKELNAFVLRVVEEDLREVAVADVNDENNVSHRVFASRKQSLPDD